MLDWLMINEADKPLCGHSAINSLTAPPFHQSISRQNHLEMFVPQPSDPPNLETLT